MEKAKEWGLWGWSASKGGWKQEDYLIEHGRVTDHPPRPHNQMVPFPTPAGGRFPAGSVSERSAQPRTGEEFVCRAGRPSPGWLPGYHSFHTASGQALGELLSEQTDLTKK